MFTNISEFYQYVQVSNGLTLKVLQPSLQNALFHVVYNCVPKDEVNSLLAEHTAGSFSNPIRQEGFALLQNLTAKFTFIYHLPFWGLTANDAQLGRLKTDEVSLYKWENTELKEAAFAQAYQLVEMTLEFFENNVAAFPLYQAHQQRIDLQKLFVRSYKTFAQFCNLGNNRALYVRMHQFFPREQYFYLRKIIGEALYTDLQSKWLAGTVNADELLLIQDYLQPLLVYTSLVKALKELPINYSNGLLTFAYSNQDATEERNTATNNQLQIVANEYADQAAAFQKELIDFLADNLATFPLFAQAKTYTPTPTNPMDWNDGTKNLFSF